jgi:hypothetical protein
MDWLVRRDRMLLTALLLAVTLAALPILTYPLGRDQGEFATIGRGILDGRVPYVDLWNPKPPAVFYVYALAMAAFGRTTEALRAIDFSIVPIISLSLYWLGKRIGDRPAGLWAALLFPVFYFTETFWTLTQNDGIALLPMTLAMVCMFKAADDPVGATCQVAPTRAALWALAGGILSGIAVWFKYPFALFAVVPLTVPVLSPADSRRKALLIVAFLAGSLLISIAGIAYMALLGALPALIESAQVTAQYTALTFNAEDFGQLLQTHWGYRWQHWGLLWILAALWFALGRFGEPRKRVWYVVLLWAVVALVIMLVQAKAYDYHWLPILPALALLASDSMNRVIRILTAVPSPEFRGRAQNAAPSDVSRPLHTWRGRRGVRFILSSLTALAFLGIIILNIWPKAWPYLTGQETQVEYYRKFQAGEFIADESLLVADFLRERVAPGDSLFIWGFRPEVYYLSRLNPAVRFIFQFPLVAEWYPAAWREETVDLLWAALPPYVLVLQVDYMPWVTGRNEDSHTLLQEYTELNNWLIFNYERERQIGNFLIWRRKPS